MELVSCQSR